MKYRYSINFKDLKKLPSETYELIFLAIKIYQKIKNEKITYIPTLVGCHDEMIVLNK